MGLNIKITKRIALVFFSLFVAKAALTQVKMWQEQVEIRTLKVGTPAPHPTFKRDIDMLADDDQIYPYLYNSRITTQYENKSYIGCYLENKYIKLLVTPEIGGKLYGAIDKTNNYDFFYWQPTVKPALISLTGPWVSGGIEWCFPSGHRQTTYMQIEHRLIDNLDGSKTIWVGETERVHGLRWDVGITIFPEKSVIEAKVRLMNPTSLPQSQYMWAITATHANEDYQLIYPTDYMAGHNKFKYTPWPINDGKDISWWKNIPNANSYFANTVKGFFGGYDYKLNAGTVFAGNKHIIIGEKFWTWGSSPFGRMWDWILSDGGGPYAEPQAGAYSDNQPDYHWIKPGEVKYFSYFFFPVKGIGGFKQANKYGALNLEFKDSIVKIGVYSTSVLERAIVRLEYKGQHIFQKKINIDPSKPFVAKCKEFHKDSYNYKLLLMDSQGNKILSYTPKVKTKTKKPVAAIAYENPSLYKNNDELWHIGDFIYKNRDKNKAQRFFNEILNKDSLDVRANLSMSQMEIERAEYRSALKHINSASKRARDNGYLFYLKGVANEELGDYHEAYNNYYRATHLQPYFSQSYKKIAEIDLIEGNPMLAIKDVNRALTQNAKSPQLWMIKAVAHRLLGQKGMAIDATNKALEFDPLNFWALNERQILFNKEDTIKLSEGVLLKKLLLNDPQYYLALAIDYIKVGLYNDALSILTTAESNVPIEKVALLQYYKGYCYDKLNMPNDADVSFEKGKRSSMENIFPFRRASIVVFNTALKYDPKDDKANYYLGLIYAGLNNGSKSLYYFEKANQINPNNGLVLRDIGFLKIGYNGVTPNLKEARAYYEKAFEARPKDDLILMEFDNVKRSLNEDPKTRLRFLKKHMDVVEKRDDLLSSTLDLMVAFGEFKTPIHYYETHVFNNREGQYSIHNSYINAYIGMAKASKTQEEALSFYKKALLYPDNLKVKPREPNLRGFLYYPMALLYEKIGDTTKAKKYLDIVKQEHTQLPTMANYYQALAFRKVGEVKKASALMARLEAEALELINGKIKGYYRKTPDFRKALGHYYLSSFFMFKGETKKGEQELIKAKNIFPFIERDAIIWAQIKYAGTQQ